MREGMEKIARQMQSAKKWILGCVISTLSPWSVWTNYRELRITQLSVPARSRHKSSYAIPPDSHRPTLFQRGDVFERQKQVVEEARSQQKRASTEQNLHILHVRPVSITSASDNDRGIKCRVSAAGIVGRNIKTMPIQDFFCFPRKTASHR